MAHSPIRTVEMLKDEIEKTKQTIVQTDETIKKITGRDGVENRTFRNNQDFRSRDTNYEGRSNLNRKRLSGNTHIGLGRRTSNNYEDEYFYEKSKMSVASSVVARSGLAKSREEIIEQQNKDKEGNARNKRMFGLLMGTLASFKTEGNKNERQEKKRQEIEKRLEEQHKKDKEEAKKERQELFMNKKHNEIKLRRLQLKMDVVQLHEEWEDQSKQLTNYIRTDAKPNIYYLPKIHNKISLDKLEKSKKLIEAVVAKRRKLLDEELKNILEGKKDEEDDEDDDEGPPKKQPKKEDIETLDENAESEEEVDKTIREDFQISAVDESMGDSNVVPEGGKDEENQPEKEQMEVSETIGNENSSEEVSKKDEDMNDVANENHKSPIKDDSNKNESETVSNENENIDNSNNKDEELSIPQKESNKVNNENNTEN